MKQFALIACVILAAKLPLPAVDCNGNAVGDGKDIENGFSVDCNLNGVPDECDIVPVAFGFRQEKLAVAKFPRFVKTADFDGDGDMDLLTGHTSTSLTSTISVVVNEGARTFATANEFEAGENLSAAAICDLDHDGDLDVATANDTAVGVLLNRGDATFSSPVSYPVERSAYFVAVGDLNGDGFADLVAAHARSDVVSVLLNRGDGAFGPPSLFPAGDYPTSTIVNDFDDDGDLDLAVSNRNSDSVSILLNRGDGSFPPPTDYGIVGKRPFSLLAGDLDGDGAQDLVAATTTDVSVLKNEGGGGFGLPVVFHLHSAASSVAIDDIDSDGDLDLIVGLSGSDEIILIRNASTNWLLASVHVQAGVPRTRWVAAGDLDDDGRVDVALVTTDVVIVWNDAGSTQSLSFAHERYSAGGAPHSVGLGDLDGDGDMDVTTGNNDETHSASVIMNEGNGVLSPPVTYQTRGRPLGIAAARLDGDDDLDLVMADHGDNRLQILWNRGDGTYGGLVNYRVGTSPSHVTAADIDGDGAVDLICSNRGSGTITLRFNNGEGVFERRQDISTGAGPSASVAVDLDRDFDLDLAVANSGSAAVSILVNHGDGTFATPVSYPQIGGPTYIAAADFDLDGAIDLVTPSAGNNAVAVFWNTGGARFAAAELFDVGKNAFSVITSDLNGDGHADVVTANPQESTFSILLYGGDREFREPGPVLVGEGPRFVVSADMDGDGDMDVVSANHDIGDMSVLLNRMTEPSSVDFLGTICTEVDFFNVSIGSTSGRVTKYVLPARDDPALIPTTFQNVRRFSLHEDFLAGAFPEHFPTRPQGEEYNQLVGRRSTRDYFVGALRRAVTESGIVYAFTVVADTGFSAAEVLNQEEVGGVYQSLKESFELETLAYWPDTQLAREEVETWTGTDFPIFTDEGPPGVDFEAYTLATGYGRVRLFTLEEFEAANESGRFTFQDIVVVSEAPADVEGIVGGFITGTIQGPLSHVAVRTARRGTPNAFVADALEVFSRYEGQLVRLDVLPAEYSVTEASVSEAEEFWAANRPELPELPDFDPSYADFDQLTEIDLDGEVNPVSRFGGKATNLARMQRLLTGEFEEYREEGFAIPMRYYLEFMRDNIRAEEGRELTYQEYLDELLSSAEFQSDSEVRFAALKEFRDFVRENGVVDPDLVARLVERIESVFGSRTRMVRFRSSSNTEDALEFNGAGLYESTSVCAEDTVGPENTESSHCDPLREEERTIERALKKVWSSLWTFRAHEERTFFQIPPEKGAMGILCNRAFLDEAANGVAFTGNPQNARDRRYVVTAQVGEESVVSPAPGIRVERNLLGIGEGGEVLRIIRDRASSLVGEGEVVLSDDQLRSLTRLLWHVDQTYPLNLEGQPREQVLLDFEFKVEPDGSLAVKQVRPFLIPDSAPPSPDFELVVPAGTVACGVFSEERVGRGPREEYETKSIVRFREGTQALPTGADSFSADIIEEVLFGPEQQMATPDAPGLFRVVTLGGSGSETVYRFTYEQSFTLPGGESFEVAVFGLRFKGRASEALEKSLILDDEYLTFDLVMQGALAGEPVVAYSSCTYAQLPRWEVTVDLREGDQISLSERFLPSENLLSTGPASLRRAVVELEGARQSVTDYWRMVYSARRHNQGARYWVVLDPPLSLPSLFRAVHVVEIVAPDPPAIPTVQVSYLDENFALLGQPQVIDFDHRPAESPEFQRGDVDADGETRITDALSLLSYLFLLADEPACEKAADANDDGKLNVTDGVQILLHLFAGEGPLPEPSGCGADPTADELSCEAYAVCD